MDTVGFKGITLLPLPERCRALSRLHERLLDIIKRPDLVVIEGLDSSRSTGAAHERSYLWYRLVSTLVSNEVPVIEIASARLKIYAVGKGHISKRDVVLAVQQRYPQFAVGSNHNKADAAVLAMLGAHLAGWPVPAVPSQHTRFFNELNVPDGVRPERKSVA
jgi:Holliday junction resolvasome RuvABC endonuclease subunit